MPFYNLDEIFQFIEINYPIPNENYFSINPNIIDLVKENQKKVFSLENILKSLKTLHISHVYKFIKEVYFKPPEEIRPFTMYFSNEKFVHILIDIFPIHFFKKKGKFGGEVTMDLNLNDYIIIDNLFTKTNKPDTFSLTIDSFGKKNIIKNIKLNGKNISTSNLFDFNIAKRNIIHTCSVLNIIVVHFLIHSTNDLILNSIIKNYTTICYHRDPIIDILITLSENSQAVFWIEKLLIFDSYLQQPNTTNKLFGLQDDPVSNVQKKGTKVLNYDEYFSNYITLKKNTMYLIYKKTTRFINKLNKLLIFSWNSKELKKSNTIRQNILYYINANIDDKTDVKFKTFLEVAITYICNIHIHTILHHILSKNDPDIILRKDLNVPIIIAGNVLEKVFTFSNKIKKIINSEYHEIVEQYEDDILKIMNRKYKIEALNTSIHL